MEFYLNNQLTDKVVNGVVVNETLDETFYSASAILALDNQKEAIKPYTPFKIVDNGEELYFVIQSDNVELQSKSPLIYRHSLNLIEETELLKTKQLRNTICQQPSRKKKTKVLTSKVDEVNSSEYLIINDYERVSKVYLEVFGYRLRETSRAPKPAVGNPTINMSAEYNNTRALVVVKNNGEVIFSEEKEWNGKGEKIELPLGEYNTLKIEITLKTPTQSGQPFIYYTACAKLYVETYYYTLLDVIALIRKRSNYSFNISRNLADLDNIISPNFAFTETNVFNALNEVFSFIDGRPILRKGELDIKYFNEKREREVIEEDLTGYKSTLTNEKYVNGLMSKFQNAGFETPIFYPSENDFASPKPTELGVPNETSWAMIVDKKIRYIQSLKVQGKYTFPLTITGGGFDYNISMDTILLDLTDYTFEDTNYLQLPKITNVNFNDLSNKNLQNNSFHYKSGSNEINYFNVSKNIIGVDVYGVGFTLFRAFHEEISKENYSLKKNQWDGFSIDDKELTYRVSYFPLSDGKLIIEQSENKFNGAIRLSQDNGATNINRMGQNLFGQLIRMGNEERVATPKVSAFKERFKPGDTYNKEWLVNKATTTIFKNFSFQTLQLTKNYNKMSQFVKLNQVKRFNEIDSSVVGKSEEIIKEYIYFDTKNLQNVNLMLKNDYIFSGIMATLDKNVHFVNNLNMSAFTNERLDYYVKIPMITYGSGNALCFEFSFDSPISAGTQLVKDEAFYGTKYFSKYCLYTDENGRFSDYEIQVGYWFNKTIEEHPKTENIISTLPYINTTIDYSDSILGSVLDWTPLLTLKGNFDKQANEIFALNYEIICLTKNTDLFIGNAFITKNRLVNNEPIQDVYLYFSNEKYSVMDTLAKGTQGSVIKPTLSGNSIRIGKAQKCKSWAIAYASGELLFSCNEPKENDEDIILYLGCQKNRI